MVVIEDVEALEGKRSLSHAFNRLQAEKPWNRSSMTKEQSAAMGRDCQWQLEKVSVCASMSRVRQSSVQMKPSHRLGVKHHGEELAEEDR